MTKAPVEAEMPEDRSFEGVAASPSRRAWSAREVVVLFMRLIGGLLIAWSLLVLVEGLVRGGWVGLGAAMLLGSVFHLLFIPHGIALIVWSGAVRWRDRVARWPRALALLAAGACHVAFLPAADVVGFVLFGGGVVASSVAAVMIVAAGPDAEPIAGVAAPSVLTVVFALVFSVLMLEGPGWQAGSAPDSSPPGLPVPDDGPPGDG